MRTGPEKIEVFCPKCGESFGDWQLSDVDPAVTSRCRHCGYDMLYDQALRMDGAWEPPSDDLEATEH